MEFRIADTFTGSMARLMNDEQKLVKTTAFDLQLNPSSPGMQFHKLDRAKDKNFWSVRVGRDIRLIVHKTASSLLLCYAGHHDDAYAWAERRKIERHPATGAAQLVEVRERVQEIVVPAYIPTAQSVASPPPLFANISNEQLMSFGVPEEWLGDVRLATDETLLDLAEHLPREAAEALLDLATGHHPPPLAATPAATANPFEHPAAQQRFRLMNNMEELARALDAPWDRWAVFLHPDQESLVHKKFSGPAGVAGSAGTGKTVVALHRAVHLARTNVRAKILLTTFSETLARMLRSRVLVLVGTEPQILDRISVEAIDTVGIQLYSDKFGVPHVIGNPELRNLLHDAGQAVPGHRFSDAFLLSEWTDVVDAWQIQDWESYKNVPRLGRKTRLAEKQRQLLWQIFEHVQSSLKEKSLTTMAAVFTAAAEHIMAAHERPFQHVVVDEAQDISVAQLRFLAAIAGKQADGLFFTGDLGQRIFQSPFSWNSLGVNVRGRSHTLRINYRTSHQIRQQADRLLPSNVTDVDGIADQRARTLSVFNGPPPQVAIAKSLDAEAQIVGEWLKARITEGIAPHEIAVFVRSQGEIPRANRAVATTGVLSTNLTDIGTSNGKISVGTMHEAKGLEFRAVVVMACDEDIIPSAQRVGSVTDESDLKTTYETERQLLYVACTRSRDHLLVIGVHPASEFLDDFDVNPRS